MTNKTSNAPRPQIHLTPKPQNNTTCVICREHGSEERCQRCDIKIHKECLNLINGQCPTIGCQGLAKPSNDKLLRQIGRALFTGLQLLFSLLVSSITATVVLILLVVIGVLCSDFGNSSNQAATLLAILGLIQWPFTSIGGGIWLFKRRNQNET